MTARTFLAAIGSAAVLFSGVLVLTDLGSLQAQDPSPAQAAESIDRPLLTPEQYKALADELRVAYAKPATEWPAPRIDPGVDFVELGSVPDPVGPPDNPITKEKTELGKLLFFDPRLSGSGQVSCASCHEPELGWADGRTVSFGHDRQPGKRNAPTVMNAGFKTFQFWDGRAASLEEQALGPIGNPIEMHGEIDQVAQRISGIPGYQEKFRAAFGEPAEGEALISPLRIAQAIATFERTVTSGRSRFDAFVRGRADALSDSALRGLHLFRTDARCVNCHHGPNFTDNRFHNLGLSHYGNPRLEDRGRWLVTKDPKDMGAFKTPTVRNVTRTVPYMHSGLFATLDEVLRLYNVGMFDLRPRKDQLNDPLFPKKSPLLHDLGLNDQDLEDLKAFLQALEEPRVVVRMPELPPGPEAAAAGTDKPAPETAN